jgi:hypothetical protein
MKKQILFLLCLVFSLCACQPKTESLIGEWVADKVNVQFDESRNTPELVKQIGEMEKQNMLSISSDSLLVFKGLDDEKQGRLSIDKQGNLLLEGIIFGQWKNGQIVTRTPSPLGEIVVTYRKKGA